MKGVCILLLQIAVLCTATYVPADPLEVRYPRTSENAARDRYQLDLLEFLLNKARVDYTIEPARGIYTQGRIMRELQGGKTINVYWMGTSPWMERSFNTVYYPIYRGLLGYRIFIIHRDRQKVFDKVNTLRDLQKLTGIQGIGWSDIKILEHSGLRQKTAKYENIFSVVDRNRVDYFSRGLNEAYAEVEARRKTCKNLAIEKRIVLVYPFAMFFFVAPGNSELAEALNRGFRLAYEDGSFRNWFYSYPTIASSIAQARLGERVRITIPNPLLTEKTRNIPPMYWH